MAQILRFILYPQRTQEIPFIAELVHMGHGEPAAFLGPALVRVGTEAEPVFTEFSPENLVDQ